MTITRHDPGQRFCRAVVYNGVIYLAGFTATDLGEGTTGQTRQILEQIDAALAKAGTSKARLLTANIWLRDIAEFDQMNAAWDAWVDPANMPVRATVEARLAGDAYRVEIQVTAAV
jgi:enamine deaminase RidA (YjgF/YER057c/UK114 family)